MKNPTPNRPDSFQDISPRLFRTALCMMAAVSFIIGLLIYVVMG